MEVRCVNKKYAKAQADKDAENHPGAHHHHGHVNQSDSSENSASKKIVDKLRHDVKGFRSVLKKSRYLVAGLKYAVDFSCLSQMI